MDTLRSILGLGLLALLLTGCASTPEKRIAKDPALFNSFPSEAQARIQKGEIDLGFTPDMVLMAKDKPDRKYNRKTTAGDVEVWSYTRTYTTTDRQRVETRVRAPDAGGNWRYYTDWTWVDVQNRHEYDQFRVEFTGGKVTAMESLER